MSSSEANRGGLPAVGFIGLGRMGGRQARRLIRAGYVVTVYDTLHDRIQACVDAGGRAAGSAAEAVIRGDWVMTSLPSSATWTEVAEESLLPNARAGQVFMDMGTTEVRQTRRLAALLAVKGAALLDTPVSGGERGSETGALRIFAGGDSAVFERSRPILEVLGPREHVVYCGPSGCGQFVKGVNQLMMGLIDAAALEAISLGVHAGVDPAAIRQAVGGTDGARGFFASMCRRVEEGRAEGLTVKFPELHYSLDAAHAEGMNLPLTKALFEFLDAGPRNWRDNMDRPDVSFWFELMHRPFQIPGPTRNDGT